MVCVCERSDVERGLGFEVWFVVVCFGPGLGVLALSDGFRSRAGPVLPGPVGTRPEGALLTGSGRHPQFLGGAWGSALLPQAR
jgi:hypothetical protein